MIDPADFIRELKNKNITFFTGVPGSILKDFCHYVSDHVSSDRHVTTANEGAAVSLGAGHYLGTGLPSLVYLQNTGQGNTIHPLLSLNDSIVYGIPCLLLIGWRGEPGTEDAPQHLKQGEVTLEMLKTLEIDFSIISKDTSSDDISTILRRAAEYLDASHSYALVVEEGTFVPYKSAKKAKDLSDLSRREAVEAVTAFIDRDGLIISSAGMISRELYEERNRKNKPHDQDFLVLGSMGHASQVAAGLALSQKDRKIYCLDGDGALIMHMGNMAINGSLQLKNFTHIVLNNGSYESAGCQSSAGSFISFSGIAKSCGYNQVYSVSTKEELSKVLKGLSDKGGPVFLEIRVKTGSEDEPGRPDEAFKKLMGDFMGGIL